MRLLDIIKKNKRSFGLLFSLGLIAVFFTTGITFTAMAYEETIRNFTYLHWAIFFIATSFTMAFAMTPTTFIALFTGYFIGFSAIIFLVVSYLAAALLGLFLGKFIDKGKFLESIKDTQEKGTASIITNLQNNEFSIIFFARLSPILPFAIMNILLSILKTRIKPYIIGSLMGMLPRTALSVYIGSQVAKMEELIEGGDNPLWKIITIVLIIVSAIGILKTIQNSVQKKIS
jgi:uncharacterized membrane protein YdjX (TVP38/TMEM64 family)